VENIPLQAEHHSGRRAKLFAFPTGIVFTFRPECCSESQRNGVQLQTGIAFTFDRIPQHTYRPVDFDSLDDLLKVFKAALPAFDVSRFPREKQPVSSILFAEVIELSDTTLDTWTQEIERLDVLARHRAGKQITRSQKCARSPVWRKLVSILSLAFTTGPSKKLGDACSHCVSSEYRATTSQRTPFLRQQWSCVSAGN